MTERQEGIARARHVLILLNPTAGRRRRALFDATLVALGRRNVVVTLRTTERAGHATELARAATTERFDAVIAAGGDGTIYETINGLVGSTMPFGVVPLGTANIFAASVGLRRRAERIAETIATASPTPIKLGRFGDRYFALMISCGPDARVVEHLNLRLKRLTGRFAYAWETWRQFLHFRPIVYEADIDGVAHRAHWIIVANQKFHAGPYTIAPDARWDDDKLHVVLMVGGTRWAMLGYGIALFAGRLPDRSDVKIIAAAQVTLRGPSSEPLQADGEIAGRLPVTVECVPAALRVLMP
ncbi:MAG: diacylglycerol kinase family protein [Alphaproteobacteria bacterium]